MARYLRRRSALAATVNVGEDEASCDLLYMALACDQTRVATLMLTFSMSFMSMGKILGVKFDVHDMGHHSTLENMTDTVAWHVKWVGYLSSKLRSAPEGGGTVWDLTALVFLPEGGWGFDPELAEPEGGPHSTENMIALVGGRAGGLKAGQHIRANGKHPTMALVSAMSAVGVANGRLGEVQGGIPELFA